MPIKPWSDPRLLRMPGLVPIEVGDWLQIDDAYGAQVAYRQDLVSRKGDAVLRAGPDTEGALLELLEKVLGELDAHSDFTLSGNCVTCPDGREVLIDRKHPLICLSALVQEDFCLLEKPTGADEHVLTAALLCFPASWTLAQKFMRPLVAIHAPVASYDGDIARRVQRLFDGVQAARPIWRANCLLYDDPELYQPRTEDARRVEKVNKNKWVRVERQSIVKLPISGAVVFSIHTYVVPMARLNPADRALLLEKY